MPKRLSVPLSDDVIAAVDNARGELSKAEFVRRAIMQALWDTADIDTALDAVEDWRKARGL